MRKRLAYEEVTLVCNDNSHISLRPSLRAACTLERLHDGFPALFNHIEQFHLATIREIIVQAASNRQEAIAFLSILEKQPLRVVREITVASLLALCAGFFPYVETSQSQKPNQPAKPTKKQPATPVTMQDVYAELFAAGTGLLGWTPAETWNATPTEIATAARGRNLYLADILKAIVGAPEDDKPKIAPYTDEQLDQIVKDGIDPNFDRAALADLKASL
ncbi:phage tail assembly chaperone [Brucella sp. 6810]|uniref:phage tail assembly chaperone n=1 Tax=unclassified Brucella TaxID=2632610 RepID=UPI00084F9FE6|nr:MULTISPECIES: phage tail assembly chaperone [unclassified Brucella]OEI84570.1 hypothetical protein BA060_02615 [Brucella sp. B13-0095]QMV26848.1 phage tail assembly chaperone [Brucella sp. BO3]QNQ63110.1 phage tail assembly chaperone [Brucella sp. 6810]